MNRKIVALLASASLVAGFSCDDETEDEGTGGSASSSTSTSTSTSTSGDPSACTDCFALACDSEANDCMDDSACVGTDCTCCMAHWQDYPNCEQSDLNSTGQGYFDALMDCACVDCGIECAAHCD